MNHCSRYITVHFAIRAYYYKKSSVLTNNRRWPSLSITIRAHLLPSACVLWDLVWKSVWRRGTRTDIIAIKPAAVVYNTSLYILVHIYINIRSIVLSAVWRHAEGQRFFAQKRVSGGSLRGGWNYNSIFSVPIAECACVHFLQVHDIVRECCVIAAILTCDHSVLSFELFAVICWPENWLNLTKERQIELIGNFENSNVTVLWIEVKVR